MKPSEVALGPVAEERREAEGAEILHPAIIDFLQLAALDSW
jgi:hypothetical protein